MSFKTATVKWCPFIDDQHYRSTVKDSSWPIRALYAAPAAVPLTDEQIGALWDDHVVPVFGKWINQSCSPAPFSQQQEKRHEVVCFTCSVCCRNARLALPTYLQPDSNQLVASGERYMSDLTQRLRASEDRCQDEWCAEAADTIEAQAERVRVLTEALERYVDHFGDPLQCARAALEATK